MKLKFKKPKSQLDEMLAQKLQKAESIGFWIALGSLGFCIGVQLGMGLDFSCFAGELVIAAVLLVYLWFACYRDGIWDRYAPANSKANIIASLFTGSCAAFVAYGESLDANLTNADVIKNVVLVFAGTFAAVLLLSSISLMLYKKRRNKLDEE